MNAITCCCKAPLSIPNPISWISSKVKQVAEKVFGYILRIITFQMGEMHNKCAFTIMRIYQKLSSDPKEDKPFDPKRLEISKKLLLSFGGEETTLHPSKNTSVHTITFSSKKFYEKFAELGSERLEIIFDGRRREVLLDPPKEAAKFYFPTIDVKMLDGTKRKGALLPEKPKTNRTPHILHSHSPGRSMCMDRKFIGLHLAAGYDVTIWDPRGTAESIGTPSEAGHYLDSEAVMQHVLDSGVDPKSIYLSGFCKGAALATHLKEKYHSQGVHLIASNPYTSMTDVVKGYGIWGKTAARYGMKALKDPSIGIREDGFDNVQKLKGLSESDGKCIFIHTDTDKMMPPHSVDKLMKAFNHKGPCHEILRVHPNPKENGHMQPPYEDEAVWRRYIQYVV